jgi:hypothetical protein
MPPKFPDLQHRLALKKVAQTKRGFDFDLLTEIQRKEWHAYDYGERRIYLQTRDDQIPTDPDKVWFDAELAAQAEIFWSKVSGKQAPPLLNPAKARLTDAEWRKHRNGMQPLWDLVRRAQAGEDVHKLIAERRQLTESIFALDPDLRRINDIIEGG